MRRFVIETKKGDKISVPSGILKDLHATLKEVRISKGEVVRLIVQTGPQ